MRFIQFCFILVALIELVLLGENNIIGHGSLLISMNGTEESNVLQESAGDLNGGNGLSTSINHTEGNQSHRLHNGI